MADATGKTTIFLDVDGVLNSYPVTGLRALTEGRRRVHAWHYELHYRPSIVRALERIAAADDAEIVWLSTWSHRCTEEIEPKLGFRGSYDVIPMPDDTQNRFAYDPELWWKAIAVKEWIAEHPDDRFVWIDDDLAAPATHRHFSELCPDRLLMVVPAFHKGLTKRHLRRIRRFAAGEDVR